MLHNSTRRWDQTRKIKLNSSWIFFQLEIDTSQQEVVHRYTRTRNWLAGIKIKEKTRTPACYAPTTIATIKWLEFRRPSRQFRWCWHLSSSLWNSFKLCNWKYNLPCGSRWQTMIILWHLLSKSYQFPTLQFFTFVNWLDFLSLSARTTFSVFKWKNQNWLLFNSILISLFDWKLFGRIVGQ